jgi:hypothetical protein
MSFQLAHLRQRCHMANTWLCEVVILLLARAGRAQEPSNGAPFAGRAEVERIVLMLGRAGLLAWCFMFVQSRRSAVHFGATSAVRRRCGNWRLLMSQQFGCV